MHIGFFGKRNAGKSSVMNAVTGQDLAVVSDVKGTTTDPVYKTMELLPLGPVVMMDTPGIDDEGELGELRVKKSYQVLNKTDIAVVVIDGTCGVSEEDLKITERIQKKNIPYIIVRAVSSISICMILRFSSSISAGIESSSVLTNAHASSTRSIALSGRKRSEM